MFCYYNTLTFTPNLPLHTYSVLGFSHSHSTSAVQLFRSSTGAMQSRTLLCLQLGCQTRRSFPKDWWVAAEPSFTRLFFLKSIICLYNIFSANAPLTPIISLVIKVIDNKTRQKMGKRVKKPLHKVAQF